jgi:hypothetical protein
LQDDTYTESYISTIGVDFVSGLGRGRSTTASLPHLWDAGPFSCMFLTCVPLLLYLQKIRTVELDGKVIKLQIVSFARIG